MGIQELLVLLVIASLLGAHDGCRTSDGRACKFPFTFRKKTYYKCATVTENTPWCSTKVDSSGKHVGGGRGNWGFCSNSCYTCLASNGKACVFPFTFRSKIYSTCTTVTESKPWCSTNVDSRGVHVSGVKEWGYCSRSCPVCGITTNILSRIVGGTTAAQGAWPWQVAIMKGTAAGKRFTKRPNCGGTLITGDTVISAAHCFRNGSKYFIRVGDTDNKRKEAQEEVVGVKSILKHPRYNRRTHEHDIAIITLDSTVVLEHSVFPACLPQSEDNTMLSQCYVTGWGWMKHSRPTDLQELKVPIVDNKECLKAYPGKIKDGMMCAGLEEGGIDTCQGDSGGPLVCKRAGKYELRGVTSWGEGCAKKERYGVYTRVYSYMSWIRENVKL